MKKHIPQSLLTAEPHTTTHGAPQPSSNGKTNSFHMNEKTHSPVIMEDLISSIAQRNKNAMSPARIQKKQNTAAPNSVLNSIFSS
ncbi:hypothetical protein SP90_00460 [Halodesulfovibrio spirochaetisodalis]|uniref:Uncharacterized protein n=1 Tax=Halodesulfovibrio spirochaetisodalis TaxID=1560234 RepID=A0A1B7XQ00_9BACT|nr:hypothetical protein SP90_00460 [Halodesulfovibrio spirochaetisodalis]